MVALGLFGCIEAARRFEVNVKLCALLISKFVERFVLLVQRNFALEDIFRKVFRFEFINITGTERCDVVRMHSRIELVAYRCSNFLNRDLAEGDFI